jgi:hypothetical protein
MDISWKYHINYHIIEWTFWDLLIISVDTPPLINYVANLVQYHRLSKCQFFVVQNWGAFFFAGWVSTPKCLAGWKAWKVVRPIFEHHRKL